MFIFEGIAINMFIKYGALQEFTAVTERFKDQISHHKKHSCNETRTCRNAFLLSIKKRTR